MSRRLASNRAAPLVALLALGASALATRAAAQDDRLRVYRSAVESYRSGGGEALQAAATWPTRTVRSDARRLLDDRDPTLARGVVLLLTELASSDTTAQGTERLGLAEMLVSNLPRSVPNTKAFQERWYTYVVSVMLAELNPAAAHTICDLGLRLVGESDPLQILSGIAFEMSTYPHATCPPTGCRSTDDERANRRDLMLAAAAYRRALAHAPHSADGHLRLGRVLFLLGDGAAARRELAEAEQNSNRIVVRYLVALFRADIDQSQGDLRAAAEEAERALALGPDFQSARIALANLSDRLGLADRSRQIITESLQQPWNGDPWWEFRQPAEDADALKWMREHLQE